MYLLFKEKQGFVSDITGTETLLCKDVFLHLSGEIYQHKVPAENIPVMEIKLKNGRKPKHNFSSQQQWVIDLLVLTCEISKKDAVSLGVYETERASEKKRESVLCLSLPAEWQLCCWPTSP